MGRAKTRKPKRKERPKPKTQRSSRPRSLNAYEGMKIVVLDRGQVEFAYPDHWSVEPDPHGFMRIEDPEENCVLEVSYLKLPPLPPDFPSLEKRLLEILEKRESKKDEPYVEPEEDDFTIHRSEQGDMEVVWSDYTFKVPDPAREGEIPLAHGRWLLGANPIVQTLWTYYYWADHKEWAVRWWERIYATLQLGHGVPMKDPNDHWALTEPS